MTEGAPPALAEARDYDQLVEAIRARKAALGVSDAVLDNLTGLATGYTGKLLGSARVKHLGPLSLGLVLQALGLVLVVVEDPEATAKMRSRYLARADNAVREHNSASPLSTRLLSRVFRQLGKRGGKARMRKMSARQRSDLARMAATARWVKPKRKRRPVSRGGA